MRYPLPVRIMITSVFLAGLFLPVSIHASKKQVVVGSKKFTESVIIGEIVAGLLRNSQIPASHRSELGGTRVLWDALVKGEIDVYPEYTGTLTEEIFSRERIRDKTGLRNMLSRYGIGMTASLGFNNNYAIGATGESCRRKGLQRISDLRNYPEEKLGFSNEFMARADGWPGLRTRYRLPQRHVTGMDHDLAIRGLADGSIFATDLYTTDAEIAAYRLCVLEDDLHYFPIYTSVLLYREELHEQFPAAVGALRMLEGRISEDDMRQMNERTTIGKIPESAVANAFLSSRLSVEGGVNIETTLQRIGRTTKEHLELVSISLLAAILISIPLGIIAERYPAPGQIILGFVGVIQTIPSLALLVFMIPLLGIGSWPAITALFLYSLLPIVRNTYTGLRDIPPGLRESAEALGMTAWARLKLVELPLASPSIIAGIKTSAVINVGTATLGALIGAGGYGQPILTGIRLNDVGMILQGAVPSAVLALLIQGLFELLERTVVPAGLRLEPRD